MSVVVKPRKEGSNFPLMSAEKFHERKLGRVLMFRFAGKIKSRISFWVLSFFSIFASPISPAEFQDDCPWTFRNHLTNKRCFYSSDKKEALKLLSLPHPHETPETPQRWSPGPKQKKNETYDLMKLSSIQERSQTCSGKKKTARTLTFTTLEENVDHGKRWKK